MHIYIFADMEGISGISGGSFVSKDGADYAKGCQYMTDDVNACVEGCFEGGATRVTIRDGHSSGLNLLWDKLDPRVDLIQGRHIEARFPCFDEVEGLILLGYHAMAGTLNGLMEHTYSSRDFQNVWLNGKKVGEVGLDAAIAGELGVPVLMVSGDDKVCAEALDWLPEVKTAQVKEGLGREGTKLYPRKKAHQILRLTAADAVRERKFAKPLVVQKPVTMRCEGIERRIPPVHGQRPGLQYLDGRTIEATADTVAQAFWMVM